MQTVWAIKEVIMRSKLIVMAFGTSLALAACTDTASEPIVTSFNEASVGIQIQQSTFAVMTPEAEAASIAKADARAQEICSRGPNRRAERASARQVPSGEYTISTEYLYLCLQ
jgi:Tfp pilus assembly protein PilW